MAHHDFELDSSNAKYIDACEDSQRESLTIQKRRSGRDFREGRVVSWERLKNQSNL